MTQDLNHQKILETARALDVLERVVGDDISSPTLAYMGIATAIAGNISYYYLFESSNEISDEDARRFALHTFKLANAFCIEMGDRAPNPEDIANEE